MLLTIVNMLWVSDLAIYWLVFHRCWCHIHIRYWLKKRLFTNDVRQKMFYFSSPPPTQVHSHSNLGYPLDSGHPNFRPTTPLSHVFNLKKTWHFNKYNSVLDLQTFCFSPAFAKDVLNLFQKIEFLYFLGFVFKINFW